MKTFKMLIGLCLLLSSFNLSAQTTHEVGVRFSGFNDFNFLYKKGKSETKFTRYRLGSTNFEFRRNSPEDKRTEVAIIFGVGFERRKQIVEELFFIHGFEPSLAVRYQTSNGDNAFTFTPQIGYILGVQKDFSNNLALSIEIIPSLSASYTRDNDDRSSDNYSIRGGFSTSFLSAGLVYRFEK